MPKTPTSPDARQVRRHNPLTEEYVPSHPFKQKSAKRKKLSKEDRDEEHFIGSKASRKILKIGQELADEDQEEANARRNAQRPLVNPAFAFDSRFGEDEVEENELGEYDDDEAWGDEEEIVEEVEIDPSDLDTFNRFVPTNDNPIVWPGEEAETSGPGTNLADLILQKIAAHEAAGQTAQPQIHGPGAPDDAVEIPAKVVEVYSKIGLILSRHKSGKLPKPFKILPTIPVWETLLALTRPDSWTPNAVYAATRLFISSTPATAQQFLTSILLPAVQDDIRDTHKLNVHLYAALKKALYKPSAFFKGIVFPMLGSGTCTQREAHIVASVVARVSVPVLHSAAALHRLCEMAAEQMSSDPEAAGPVNIFIRVLLEKKYALPYKVIDALVFHFLRFRAVDAPIPRNNSAVDAMAVDSESGARGIAGAGKLPVIWHQCLLVFAQRYRNDITEDQREALLDLLLLRGHKAIGPEVRRELLEGRGRGVVVELEAALGGDDTMMAVDT